MLFIVSSFLMKSQDTIYFKNKIRRKLKSSLIIDNINLYQKFQKLIENKLTNKIK